MATPNAPPPAKPEFIVLDEEDCISEELSRQIGKEMWIHKPTGRSYFPGHQMSRIFDTAPYLDPDDPYLQFLRGEIDL